MNEYDNTNRFSIWKNENKTKDTHADFTGSLNVDGVEFFVDAWKRKPDAKPNAPALSGMVKRKDKQAGVGDPGYGGQPQEPNPGPDPLDDEIPF